MADLVGEAWLMEMGDEPDVSKRFLGFSHTLPASVMDVVAIAFPSYGG